MARVKTALTLLCSVIIVSPFALAADLGTYRPGQPYAATQAVNHNACVSQCKGDAACKGWNFVKANPRQTHGICEFNSVAVDPIQSPIGISANQSTIINYAGNSQIISAGIRTTRIGRPTAPQTIKEQPSPQSVPLQAPSTQNLSRQQTKQPIQQKPTPARPATRGLSIAEQLSPQPTRKITREPIPEQKTVRPVAYRHNLDTQSQQIPYRGRPNITRTQNGLPPRAPQYQNQQNTPRQQFADPRLIQQFNRTQTPPPPTPSVAPVKTSENTITRPQRGGLIQALTQGGQTNGTPTPQPRQKAPILNTPVESVETAIHKSLYGHLNDDVAIPKPLTLEDLNIPDDKPIPTAASVPVTPIDREEFSGLAGR